MSFEQNILNYVNQIRTLLSTIEGLVITNTKPKETSTPTVVGSVKLANGKTIEAGKLVIGVDWGAGDAQPFASATPIAAPASPAPPVKHAVVPGTNSLETFRDIAMSRWPKIGNSAQGLNTLKNYTYQSTEGTIYTGLKIVDIQDLTQLHVLEFLAIKGISAEITTELITEMRFRGLEFSKDDKRAFQIFDVLVVSNDLKVQAKMAYFVKIFEEIDFADDIAVVVHKIHNLRKLIGRYLR